MAVVRADEGDALAARARLPAQPGVSVADGCWPV
jgi:hypothetical protein